MTNNAGRQNGSCGRHQRHASDGTPRARAAYCAGYIAEQGDVGAGFSGPLCVIARFLGRLKPAHATVGTGR